MDERLATVQAKLAGEALDDVIGHGEEHQLDLFQEPGRFGKGARARNQAAKSFAPGRIAGRDGNDRPAHPMERRAERGPDGPRTEHDTRCPERNVSRDPAHS